MSRAQNFFYRGDSNLPAVAGASLGRALFGDTGMAAAQQKAQSEAALRQAQAGEATAHGDYYNAQRTGQEGQNTAASSLAGLIAGLTPPAPMPVAQPSDPLAARNDEPPPVDRDAYFKSHINPVISALAGMKGDKVDLSQVIGSLGAYGGGDETARRALVAQGHSPTADFAITPDRADTIAATDATAKMRSALGVATANHASDIPTANIQARSHIAGEQIQAGASRYGHDQTRIASEYATDNKDGGGRHVALDGFNPGGINDGPFARSQPGYAGSNGRYAAFKDIASGEAAQATLLRGYIRGGYDTPQKIADRWAPAADGNNPIVYAQTIAKTLGIGVNDKLSPDDVERFQQAQGRAENAAYVPKAKKADALPKPVGIKAGDDLDDQIKAALSNAGIEAAPGNTTSQLRADTISRFQATGNATLSAQQAVAAMRAAHPTRDDERARANLAIQQGRDPAAVAARFRRLTGQSLSPPVQGARQAGDGKWYVQRGRKADGSPQYFRVGA